MLMWAPMLDFLTQKFATITAAQTAAIAAAEQHLNHSGSLLSSAAPALLPAAW
jgi:hypothetical protein